jgi:hypothetical protein
MADNNKKPRKTSGWVAVGDSMEGIKNLRPDVIKQKIQQIDAQMKKAATRTASSGTAARTPVVSSTGKTTSKGK